MFRICPKPAQITLALSGIPLGPTGRTGRRGGLRSPTVTSSAKAITVVFRGGLAYPPDSNPIESSM